MLSIKFINKTLRISNYSNGTKKGNFESQSRRCNAIDRKALRKHKYQEKAMGEKVISAGAKFRSTRHLKLK